MTNLVYKLDEACSSKDSANTKEAGEDVNFGSNNMQMTFHLEDKLQ